MKMAPGILGALGVSEAALRCDEIVERDGQWCVTSEDGARSFGCYDSREEAEARLAQIERFAEGAMRDDLGHTIQRRFGRPIEGAESLAEGLKQVTEDAARARVDGAQVVTRCDRLGPVVFCESDEEAAKLDEGAFSARLTDEGYLRIDGRMTRTGVFEYADQDGNVWGELRTEDEVFDEDSLESFGMIPLTDNHPPEMVDAKNIKKYQAGHVGSNVRRDGDYMRGDLLVTDSALIEKIKNGKTQLSNGYTALLMPNPGTLDGVEYAGIQTNIRGNHLAVVDEARGGPSCRLVFDAVGIPTSTKENTDMKVKKNADGKLMIGESEYEVPDEVAKAFEMMKDKVEEQGAELSKLAGEGDSKDELEMKEEEDEMGEEKSLDSTNIAKLNAKIDMLEAELANVEHRADARAELVADAREVLGKEFETRKVDDLTIRKAVAGSIMPALKAKIDASKDASYVTAMYDAAMEQHRNRVDHTPSLLETTRLAAMRSDAGDAASILANYQAGLNGGAKEGN